MRVRFLCIIAGFWFILIWAFRWNLPHLDLREVVLVVSEVSNYFSIGMVAAG